MDIDTTIHPDHFNTDEKTVHKVNNIVREKKIINNLEHLEKEASRLRNIRKNNKVYCENESKRLRNNRKNDKLYHERDALRKREYRKKNKINLQNEANRLKQLRSRDKNYCVNDNLRKNNYRQKLSKNDHKRYVKNFSSHISAVKKNNIEYDETETTQSKELKIEHHNKVKSSSNNLNENLRKRNYEVEFSLREL
ncbi:uncharacterized protein LOC131675279 [Phymastichus coffea]|uniref:uncharacterized protein LOC131675279 n=1 Tax=Phymastichus coffea TaxID=108790 RepID=UPI00273CB7DA|nr:uncharacterized protein LOC131675279 [Phymastichus coffea]